MLIQNTLIEVQKVHQGPGADLLGVDLIPDHIPGHVVWLALIQGLGHHHLDHIHEINTAAIQNIVDHLRTPLSAVMIEDEPRGNLDPVGRKTALRVQGTAAALRRHLAVNTSRAETSLHIRESTARAGRL